jgi:hypothetical protein
MFETTRSYGVSRNRSSASSFDVARSTYTPSSRSSRRSEDASPWVVVDPQQLRAAQLLRELSRTAEDAPPSAGSHLDLAFLCEVAQGLVDSLEGEADTRQGGGRQARKQILDDGPSREPQDAGHQQEPQRPG